MEWKKYSLKHHGAQLKKILEKSEALMTKISHLMFHGSKQKTDISILKGVLQVHEGPFV